jgi:hypothetical protein
MQKNYKNLVNLFQNIFKFSPSLVIKDELGCTVSTVIKHKNTKITLEISELNEEEVEGTTPKFPVEFHELKLKNGTSHYIISFFLQNDTARYVVRVYLE